MKRIIFALAALLSLATAHAEKGPRASSRSNAVVANMGSVELKFNNLTPGSAGKDSVLIIFDRYNHTGAGVVYQVFKADQDQQIHIEGVPEGKYFVTIQGLGLHRDHQERVIRVSAGKNGKFNVNLEDSEEFVPGNVVIPEYRPSFSDMVVLK